MPTEILRLSFPDLGALEREIATNLRYGRVFVGEILDAPLLTEGDLVIVHPVHGRELRLAAQVVMVNNDGPMRGTGIALRGFGPTEVERVQAFAREVGAAADVSTRRAVTPEPRPREMTPEPRPREMTPQPRPREMMPQPRPREMTPQPRPREMMPQPRPREMTPQPRPREMTPQPRPREMMPQPRPREMTPQPRPREMMPQPRPREMTPQPRPREMTPVPLPVSLMERPRRGTPDQRSEAVTVRPSTGPLAMGTVPPSAPENDWSDLPSSGFARVPARNDAPAAAAEEPAPPEMRASPPPSAASDDDWSDFADPDAEARAAAFAAKSGEVPAELENAVEAPPDAPPPELPVEAPDDTAAASGSETESPSTEAFEKAPVADDDWSDVAAAVAEPVAAAAAAVAPPIEPSETEAIAEAASGEEERADDETGFDDDPHFDPNAPARTELQNENRQQRLRTLNVVEQLKIARRGELTDRVVVERLYGKQVWEALLQNPRITLPEVARIAGKGTVPRPLIESIVENAMWTKSPNVRRALLSNPKLTAEGVVKLLKMMPKHELKIMEKATAYPMAVREAARKLLREEAR